MANREQKQRGKEVVFAFKSLDSHILRGQFWKCGHICIKTIAKLWQYTYATFPPKTFGYCLKEGLLTLQTFKYLHLIWLKKKVPLYQVLLQFPLLIFFPP